MDFSRFSLTDLPLADLIPQPSEPMIAAVVSAVATLALVAAFRPRGARRGSSLEADGPDPAACDFLINGTSLKSISEPGRALLAGLGRTGSRLAALTEHLAQDFDGIQDDIETLVLYGTGFRRHSQRRDGSTVEVLGSPRGDAAFLSIRPASEDARALQEARAALRRTGGEARFLRDVIDHAPVIAWSLSPEGKVTWANAAYRDRFDTSKTDLPDHRLPNAFGHVLEEVPLTAKGSGSRSRVSVAAPGDAEARWYEVLQSVGAGGETLGYALAADDLVSAEASLRRFVETLTETFAHLPIGLAVFDKNRRLGLFNPALTDLVKIDAVWLAGRPSLRDFLERLRETRQMPDQKDFTSWRRKLGELEEGARDGTYEENWVLPSGKIFRVTGRPHPQGALAFLFEDISSAIMIERKYRSELELSQATFDRLSEAVALFDASGSLVFVNSAFETLWGVDPMNQLDGPGIGALTSLWSERCAPSAAWERLTEFATAAEARTSWNAALQTTDGRQLEMRVAPMPDASALVVFREVADSAGETAPAVILQSGDSALDGLALDLVASPAETLLNRLRADAVPGRLDAAAAALRDGLDRARDLATGARGTGRGTLPGLTAMLAGRGLALDAPDGAGLTDPERRRAAFALALGAADLAARDGTLQLAVGEDASGSTLTVTVPADPAATEGAGTALARRVISESGGTLEIGRVDGIVRLSARLPIRVPGAPDGTLAAVLPLHA